MNSSALPWLLENPSPGVRYLARRDVLRLPSSDAELMQCKKAAHREGEIARLLDAMHPDGYWSEPGAGYNPKYFSGVWSLILLAQLGASLEEDERIRRACRYLMEHALNPAGQFSMTGPPSGTLDCLQGNLCRALLELGIQPAELQPAFEWMARTVTSEGLAPLEDKKAALRYYAGNCGPNFACGANDKLPCAWGAVKVMLAFGRLPQEMRTPLIEDAIQKGVDFLFSTDPAAAGYPCSYAAGPSGNWWKFGFPVFYITDLLQLAEALVGVGCGADPRLAGTLDLIRRKQDAQGRWALEYDYRGKTWLDFGEKKQPNPWVTLRSLRLFASL